ncbi:MAG TPA: DNA polymerase, partial [Ktedonobacteraceae bacterium]|nr:DNA polymerase [Ktedonobacteraceae bacterium]
MSTSPSQSHKQEGQTHREDDWLFGWDAMPGIVSVWANRAGLAVVWRREGGGGGRVVRVAERFRPWLLATTLTDLAHLGSALAPAQRTGANNAHVSYRELDGAEGSYRYLLSAQDGRALERTLLAGASRRLGKQITSLNDLPEYYRVGPVEQYLMRTGRVYFRGLTYDDLHRLQFDLETTALDPHRGRIFMVAVRDSRGLATTLEAQRPEDEARLIVDLCALIRQRDPDIIENHNLFGFDLSFLE